jgi:hypothetical protein
MILVARGGHCTQLARMESNVLKGPATTNRLGQFDIFSWALKSPKKSPLVHGAPLRRFCACKMSQKFIEIHRITGPRWSWKSMEIRKTPWSACAENPKVHQRHSKNFSNIKSSKILRVKASCQTCSPPLGGLGRYAGCRLHQRIRSTRRRSTKYFHATN